MTTNQPFRRLFSRAAMTLALMVLTTATAWAIDGITYIDENGEEHTANGVTQLTNGSTTLEAGWYVVKSEINIEGTVTITGDVTLILEDGATMNVGTSINRISGDGINCDGTLTIYGQTNGTGALSIYTSDASASSAIRANILTINGGNITAYNSDYESYAIYAKDALTINRGTVKATATGQYSMGIYGETASVTISGGNVKATGDCYGIWAKKSVTISGGNVEATYSGASSSGVTDGIYTDGVITLGWTDYTDRIYAKSYTSGNDDICINGFFTDGTDIYGGTLISEDALAGKILRPAVAYIDEDGNNQYATDYTLLTGNETYLDEGWYVAYGTVSYTGTINLDGDVSLILADGCTMNVGTSEAPISNYGIYGNSQSLAIYGQSTGDGMGALSVYTTSGMNDAIYANALTINGGNITADTNGVEAYALNADTDITINGGNVTAHTDETDADAIMANGDFNYNGGNVTTSASSGNAIKAGYYNFTWSKPGDRITIGSTGLYNDGKRVSFTRCLTDGSTTYYGDYNVSDINNTLKDKTLSPRLNLTLTANSVEDGGVTNYWTTFYCGHTGYEIDDAENACAYTAEYDGAHSQLTLHRLGKVIPEDKAVIIVGEDNSISMTASDETATVPTNNLLGYDDRTSVTDIKTTWGDGTLYVMGKVGSNFGFFEYTGTYMPASKAFLLVNGGAAQVKGLTMVFDGSEDATSIQNSKLKIQNEEAGWYSLDGRKLDGKPTAKGIFIHNGRKEVLK